MFPVLLEGTTNWTMFTLTLLRCTGPFLSPTWVSLITSFYSCSPIIKDSSNPSPKPPFIQEEIQDHPHQIQLVQGHFFLHNDKSTELYTTPLGYSCLTNTSLPVAKTFGHESKEVYGFISLKEWISAKIVAFTKSKD